MRISVSPAHLPKTVEIFGSEVNLEVLSDSSEGVTSKQINAPKYYGKK